MKGEGDIDCYCNPQTETKRNNEHLIVHDKIDNSPNK